MLSVNFAMFVRTCFIQKTAQTWGIHKNFYKRRLPLDPFEQFVSSNKGKLANDQYFESVMGEVY